MVLWIEGLLCEGVGTFWKGWLQFVLSFGRFFLAFVVLMEEVIYFA